MIEESIIKSNFIGRDGFRWWIGQVAPEEAQGDQLNQVGDAWGNRVKVRIMGYHPQNTVELKDEDLPWAQVLLSPQAGSGKANRAKSLRLSPGDSVVGFFLDGDDAQLPVIMGIFGNTAYSPSDTYKGPFQPYTGYTSKVKTDNAFILKNEVGDQSGNTAQKSPRGISQAKIDNINAAIESAPEPIKSLIQERTLNAAIGQTVVFASSNQASTINKINSEVEGLVAKVKGATANQRAGFLSEATSKISGLSSGIVGNMIQSTYKGLAPALNTGLDTLYKSVYATVLAATKKSSLAKKAGTAAQVAMVPGVKAIQNALPCIAQNILGSMLDTVKGMLEGLIDNVQNFVSCIGDQFVGGLMNQIIGGISNLLGPLLGGVGKILGGFSLGGFLRSKAEGLLGIARLLSCDNPTKNYNATTNEWVIGKGPKEGLGAAVDKIADKILAAANIANSLTETSAAGIQGLSIAGGSLGLFDFLNPSVSNPGFSSPLGKCYAGPPLDCAGIKVNIFGSNGVGASAKAIIGNVVGEFAEATGSLIGIDLTNGGSGYNTPPFVEIVDNCNKGYGAVARAVIDYDEDSPTYQQVTDIYIVSEGENYPIIEDNIDDDNTPPYTIDRVVIVDPGCCYDPDDKVIDNDGNIYTSYVDTNGKIVNVLPPDSAKVKVKSITDLPELNIETKTGFGAILKPQIKPRPAYQGAVEQVIDCVTPRDNIVGYVDGKPYIGPFHLHPDRGVKMVGIAHTSTAHPIIYDTPAESLRGIKMSSGSTSTSTTTNDLTSMSYDDSTSTSPAGPPATSTSTSTSSPPASSPPSAPPASSPPASSPPSSPPSGGGGGYGY